MEGVVDCYCYHPQVTTKVEPIVIPLCLTGVSVYKYSPPNLNNQCSNLRLLWFFEGVVIVGEVVFVSQATTSYVLTQSCLYISRP